MKKRTPLRGKAARALECENSKSEDKSAMFLSETCCFSDYYSFEKVYILPCFVQAIDREAGVSAPPHLADGHCIVTK
jgi:hypothetical protein